MEGYDKASDEEGPDEMEEEFLSKVQEMREN